MITVTLHINVTDEHVLRAYTSGFMRPDATVAERVEQMVLKGHPMYPRLSGVEIIKSVAEAED